MIRKAKRAIKNGSPSVLILGVGSFAHSVATILRELGANVITYLTRDYAHYGAQAVSKTYDHREVSSPIPLLKKHNIDLVLPMSIDWSERAWAGELLASGVPFLCATGAALNLEKERDLA